MPIATICSMPGDPPLDLLDATDPEPFTAPISDSDRCLAMDRDLTGGQRVVPSRARVAQDARTANRGRCSANQVASSPLCRYANSSGIPGGRAHSRAPDVTARV